jgi:hypothetical protein
MDKQQTISIPWIIANKKLLVSAPQGEVLDFPIGDTDEEALTTLLTSTSLWSTFFNSLSAALNVQK